MSDSLDDLKAQKKDLQKSGEYLEVSDPGLMKSHREFAETMPLQLSQMLNNIDSQSGVDDAEKALAKDMITNHFIRTQQGNRITKHMVRREGVHGFATGADEMFRSYRSNNEMMTRATVALKRMPAIAEHRKKLNQFYDALRSRAPRHLIALPQKQRDLINRGYGKRNENITARFGEDIAELEQRLKATMTPSAKVPFENALRTFQSIATLNYLGKPIYFAIQSIGTVISTLPNMAAEFSKMDGWAGAARATRYFAKGMADVGIVPILGRSLREAGAEAVHLLKGFKPRKNYMKASGRPMRRAYDYMQYLYDKLDRSGAKYADVKKRALRAAYDRNAIGQAGLDQPNLRMDLMQHGLKNKAMRGIEHSTRVFRALQEGIETINRAAPLMSYVEHYLAKGMSEEQATELAVNNMLKEQVGYSKANWAPWLAHPYAGSAFMFKKYAFEQGYSFYESLARTVDFSDKEQQRAAIIHVATMSVVLMALGGAVGNPLWEPIKYLLYMLGPLFGLNGTWDEMKTKGEKWLADATNPMVAETAMYGLPRLMNFDLSNRVAMDSLAFYRQPTDLSKDAWYSVLGQLAVGAMGSMAIDALGQIHGLMSGATDDESWPKWLAKLPMPGMAKDILKAYDTMAHGPTTATGVKTGEPMGLLSALVTSMGIRTREQARPFEQGSKAQHDIQVRIGKDKATLVRRINASGGMTGANVRRLNEWNKEHPEKEFRITAKTLGDARKRLGKTEAEIEKQNEEAM
jgi:hypothetical protein